MSAEPNPLAALHEPDELVEVRSLHYVTQTPRTALGKPADVEAKAAEYNSEFFNAYHTINPIHPDFRGRQLRNGRTSMSAGDDDIARIRWVPYDIDPVRRGPDRLVLKGKHSATDAEKAEAWKVAEAVAAFWRARGYDPALEDSGNGYYVLVPANMSQDNSVLIERLLKAHAATFSTHGAVVDESTFNPSRILAVPGTVKRKGEDTPERPWRMVRLLHPGSRDEELDADTLAQLLPPEPKAAPAPAPAKHTIIATSTIGPDWMEEFLAHSGITHSERRPYKKSGKAGFKWVLDTSLEDWCPNQDEHSSDNGSSTQVAFIDETGVLGFQCSHSKCGDIHWRQFRDYHEQRNVDEGRGRFREEWVETSNGTIVLRGAWLNEAVQQAETALVREKSLRYYRRGQDLVKPVSFDRQQKVAGLNRKPASVVVQEVSDESIRRDLARCCSFMQPTRGNNGKGAEKLSAVNPPRELSAHIRDRARSGEAGYDVLDMVTTSPCLLADGTVLDSPGYRERVLFLPGSTEYPRVTERPTLDDAKVALARFAALYREFPFVATEEGQKRSQTASYSAVLAAILSLVARPAIPTVPLFAITAVTAGTGKTKIAESASIAALGYAPTSVSFGDDIEFTKALVPLLREADRAILIDNVSVPLEGDMLCSVLTSEEHRARILGQSEQVRLLNRGVFFATGNNLAIQGDLTRRALLVSLDADCERPEKRSFDFEPVDVAKRLHPELAVAALTALRGFVLAGKPWLAGRPALGSFEAWDRLVCGCLLWCGYGDPVGTRDQVIESDPQREADIELLAAWHEAYGDQPKRLSDIALLGQSSQVYTLLAADAGGWDLRNVGRRLARLKGRVIGGYKLGTGSRGHKTGRIWWVKQRG